MLHNLVPTVKRRGISLTPLIDVVFILLLFFMLSSSFMRLSVIDLSVPEAKASVTKELRRIRLEDNEGNLRVGEQILNWNDHNRLSLLAIDADVFFAIEVAPEVNTQALVSLLDRLRGAGVTNVSLAGVLAKGRP